MICQRVMILNRGKIIASDSPSALMGLLHGRPCVVAEIFGSQVEVLRRLETLPGVARVSCPQGAAALADSASPAVWRRYMLEASQDAATRTAIFEMAAQNRWALRELSVEKRNLEDVFIQLTAGDGQKGDIS